MQSTGHLLTRHVSVSVSVLPHWCLVLVLTPDESPQVLEQVLHEPHVVHEQLLKEIVRFVFSTENGQSRIFKPSAHFKTYIEVVTLAWVQ